MYCCLLPPSSYKQHFCLTLKLLLRKLTRAALTYTKLMIPSKTQNTKFYHHFYSEKRSLYFHEVLAGLRYFVFICRFLALYACLLFRLGFDRVALAWEKLGRNFQIFKWNYRFLDLLCSEEKKVTFKKFYALCSLLARTVTSESLFPELHEHHWWWNHRCFWQIKLQS